MVPRLTRLRVFMVALTVLIGVSAGEAFGWGRSYYPCYQGSGYTYYYQAPAYYYPAAAPTGAATTAPSAGQPYVTMKPVIQTPPSPAVVPAPVPQYYAPAFNGGSYGGYGGGSAPRTSWNFGRFPPY
jgi:hypothetical protein